ncbi:MAG TPA: amidohydrolase family protein, partial [Polyangia bacterium]|nr:amidohydrolase family protein [Polyangia bacterium]
MDAATDSDAGATADEHAAAGAIIDTHVHFFDPGRPVPCGRPSSVPWPDPSNVLYRTTLPADYLALAKPLGISSAVVIEASSWLEDNQWILDLIAGNPAFAGFVGNLSEVLGMATFDDTLTALARNSLFRGIRVSPSQLTGGDPSNFASLAAKGMMIDVLGFPADLPAIAAFAQTSPSLRIVIDHVANVAIDGGPPPADWVAGIAAAAGQPNVYCKISGLVEGAGMTGAVSSDVALYRPTLDTVWGAFGEDRVLFGSNWPVSSVNAALPAVLSIVRSYVDEKGSAASEKAF